MNAYDSHPDSYSICVAYGEELQDGRHFIRYYRIADYRPGNGSFLDPPLLEKDFRSEVDRKTHPNRLYNPLLMEKFDSRASDFYMMRWWLKDVNDYRIWSDEVPSSSLLPRGCSVKEVIIPDGVNGQKNLRLALSSGIRYDGRTTDRFYLVFDDDGGHYLAAICDARDFILSDGMLRLRPKASNYRGVASVPIVRLNQTRIIESEQPDIIGRKVYSDTAELPEVGRLLLYPLSSYAQAYVSWFAKNEGSLSRVERQKITGVIEEAFSRPDLLEQYINAGVSDEEIHEFLLAIVNYARKEDDAVRNLICEELLKDESFHDACLEKVLRDSTDAIEEQRNVLSLINSDIEKAKKELSTIRKGIGEAEKDKEDIEKRVLESMEELDKVEEQHNEIIKHLEDDVALKLGLRAAAGWRSGNTMTPTSNLTVTKGVDIGETRSANSLMAALAKNFASLGITTVKEEPSKARERLAVAVASALATTQCLAAPTPIASAVADAISIALAGKSATHIYIPSDSREIERLRQLISSEEGVVVFDNVMDSVNEGVLFDLIDCSNRCISIMPFTSHASISLLAGEVWDRVFLLPTGAFMRLGKSVQKEKFWSSADNPEISIDTDSAIDAIKDLFEELGEPIITISSLLLPALVLEASEDYGDYGIELVSQHLTMANSQDSSVLSAISEASPGDDGLQQFLLRLGRND